MKLENWKLISLGNDGNYQATGRVYGDNRCADKTLIRTSNIKTLDFVTNKLTTLNSTYELGNHADDTVMMPYTAP